MFNLPGELEYEDELNSDLNDDGDYDVIGGELEYDENNNNDLNYQNIVQINEIGKVKLDSTKFKNNVNQFVTKIS